MLDRPAWTRRDTVAIVFVTTIAAVVRAVHLTRPGVIVSDEMFYAREACFHVYRSQEICGVGPTAVTPHPPLGKWLISLGIRAFGMNPLGWRIASLIAGIVTVALLYVLARRLFQSTKGATMAAGLLAIDLLHFVQSRLAMLDVFLTLFVVASFLFLVIDQDRELKRGPMRRRSDVLSRPWLLAAGVAVGAAAAAKWVGFLALAGVAVLSLRWTVNRQSSQSWRQKTGAAVRRERRVLLVALVMAPQITYAACFVGTIEGAVFALPWDHGSWPRSFLGAQRSMLRNHLGNRDVNTWMSPAWSWPLVRRPVTYFFEESSGRYREIKAMGSPLVWWTSLGALSYLGVIIAARRRPSEAVIVVVTGFSVLYLPLLALTLVRSFIFLYYLLPSVPFMCLAVALVSTQWAHSLSTRAIVVAFSAGALVLFAFFYPVLTATPLSRQEMEAREWFHDCELPPGKAAPDGWCWR